MRRLDRLTCAALALLATPLLAQEPDYMRVQEDPDQQIALELAARVLRPGDGAGGEVCLVAVSHVGDALLYEALQEFLAPWDVVLYESVLPAGAGRPRGETEEERRTATGRALGFVASLVEAYRTVHDTYPPDVDRLRAFALELDQRIGGVLRESLIDAHGHPVTYAVTGDGDRYRLASPCGLEVTQADGVAPAPTENQEGLQASLAQALGLEFQLTALRYDQPHWHCSDMDLEEVETAMARRGADFSQLRGTLSGTSGMGELLEMVVELIPLADALLGGGVTDGLKVMLIEMIGEEDRMLTTMERQLGSAFVEVIVRERNQAVVDDLRHLLEDEAPASVAILYGAAHMPDLEERLREQLGYRRHRSFWVPAITVDLQRSRMSGRTLQNMRRMLESMR